MRPVAIASVLGFALLATSGAAAADDADVVATKATVTAAREVGAALYYWLTDNIDRKVEVNDPEPTTLRWSACPRLTYEEARAMLVPKYIAELPKRDGWGHDLELCLARERLVVGAHVVVGVRSPGRDGRFEGDEYVAGAFDPEAFDRDVVWLDGYFVTWPQKQ